MNVSETASETSTVERNPGPERAEDREFPGREGQGAEGDDEARRQDDRQVLDRRLRRGLEPPHALREASSHPDQEEDRVVGDEPEQERHEDRLDLLRDVAAALLADPREEVHGDRVRDSRAGERDERRPERAEAARAG